LRKLFVRRRSIIEEVTLGGADKAWRKIYQKRGGMEMPSRFIAWIKLDY